MQELNARHVDRHVAELYGSSEKKKKIKGHEKIPRGWEKCKHGAMR